MPITPSVDCPLCPRLHAFRHENRARFPFFFNAPVPSFGELSARLLIVGLAPGLKGANQTGRPFTGDYAGVILYKSLMSLGLATGTYEERGDDGLQLADCRISNAVRCVPPENKPETSEIKICNGFLAAEIAAMPNLKVIVSLGTISHQAVLRAKGHTLSRYRFSHGAAHPLDGGLILIDSYHCSRYNINTGVLTQEMFDAVITQAKLLLA